MAERPEFRDRRRNLTLLSAAEVDPATGRPREEQVGGFYSFDFTLAEIKTLRARQRFPTRPATYDGRFQVPTFEELVGLVQEAEAATGRRVGIVVEPKEPYLFSLLGFDILGTLVEALYATGLLPEETPLPPPGPDVPAPLVIECFDPDALQSLAPRVPGVPLVQLLNAPRADGAVPCGVGGGAGCGGGGGGWGGWGGGSAGE